MARRTEIDPDTGMEVEYDDGLPETNYSEADLDWRQPLPEFGAQAIPPGNPPPESEYSRPPVLITNMQDGVRQDQLISREMTPEDIANWGKEEKGPMRKGVSESGTPWASNVIGWEPPKSLREDMPQLYKAPENRDIPPDPRPDMDGQKFIGFMKKEIGYDPETIDPLGQATKEIGEKYQRFGSPSDFYAGTRKMYDEDLKSRVLELSSKKKVGQDALRFALAQFNKETEWKPIGAGGSFQPGTRETISPFRAPKTPKTPNEIELTQRALQGDEDAQATLDAIDKRKAIQKWTSEKVTSVDLKRLSDMVAIATEGGKEPSVSDIAVIQDMADKTGYEFKKLTGKTAERYLFSKDWSWGGKETSQWQLVPKKTGKAKTVTKRLIGTKGGKPVYDLGNGKWQIGE